MFLLFQLWAMIQVKHARDCLAHWLKTGSPVAEANIDDPPPFLERPFMDASSSSSAQTPIDLVGA